VPDRAEVIISSLQDANGVRFARMSYVRFQFMIDPTSQPTYNGNGSSEFLLIHQVWQYSSNANAHANPPFAVFVKQDDADAAITLQFRVKTDFTTAGERNVSDYDVVLEQKVTKGKWYEVVEQLTPSESSSGEDGQIAVWFDVPVCMPPSAVWNGYWGYPVGFDGHTDEFNVRVGVYRGQQPRPFEVYFDQVKMGGSGASVSP
jgi:hypothetical protein